MRPCMHGKDVEDEATAIDHLHLEDLFEVCQGADQQATQECENQSQGPDTNSQGS